MNRITLLISLICVITALIFTWFNSTDYDKGKVLYEKTHSNFFINELSKDSLTFQQFELKENLLKSNKEVLLNDLFERRMNDYLENNEALQGLIKFFVILLVIGLLLLFFRPKKLVVPIISIEIPDVFLYLFISIGLIYMWLQFGLTLNSGINSRLALSKIIDIQEYFPPYKVSYFYSIRNILADDGLLDSWFGYYYNSFAEGRINWIHKQLTMFALFFIFGTFWGLIHAVCFILIADYKRMKSNNLINVLYAFAVLMFLASDSAFISQFGFASALMAWNWCVVLISVLLWKTKGIQIANRLELDSTKDTSNISTEPPV